MSSPSAPSFSPDNNDFPYLIEAFMVARGLKIIVEESRFQDQLRNKGFGEKEDSRYLLNPYEAL